MDVLPGRVGSLTLEPKHVKDGVQEVDYLPLPLGAQDVACRPQANSVGYVAEQHGSGPRLAYPWLNAASQ